MNIGIVGCGECATVPVFEQCDKRLEKPSCPFDSDLLIGVPVRAVLIFHFSTASDGSDFLFISSRLLLCSKNTTSSLAGGCCRSSFCFCCLNFRRIQRLFPFDDFVLDMERLIYYYRDLLRFELVYDGERLPVPVYDEPHWTK